MGGGELVIPSWASSIRGCHRTGGLLVEALDSILPVGGPSSDCLLRVGL